MRIERRQVRRETREELEARKAEALETGRRRYPGAEVWVHAYYGGTFYIAHREAGAKVAEVVPV